MKIHCDWGWPGLHRNRADIVVIVDVMSFSTCVSVAMEREAILYPFPLYNGQVKTFARQIGAFCAGKRKEEGFSLSPATMKKLKAGQKIVLPSPNGSHLSLYESAPIVFAGCLRNAAAVGMAIKLENAENILIIAAGEKRANGDLRFALEDHLGAGAIIAHLNGRLSAEAEAARIAFEQSRDDLLEVLSASESGQELVSMGFPKDILYAGALDVSSSIPRLYREERRYSDLITFPKESSFFSDYFIAAYKNASPLCP